MKRDGKTFVFMVAVGLTSAVLAVGVVELLTRRRSAAEHAPLPSPIAPGHSSV